MTAPALRAWATLSNVGPGVLASVIIAAAAGLAATVTSGPIMLFALVFGLAVNFLGKVDRCKAGIRFTSQFVLRLGVALLGLKITVGEVASLGWPPIILVLAAISLTILASIAAAKWMGFDPRFGVLSGGATAICGASAAMALSAALPDHPKKEQATLFTVVGVSILSTVAMIAYPAITRLLGFDDVHAGIFFGATIHDVAQVVGAGFAVSPETGNVATIVKLARVVMLLPVILSVVLLSRSAVAEGAKRPPLVPWFAALFAALVIINSIISLPEVIRDGGGEASRFFLVAAIAALGVKTRLGDILAVGWRPAVLMVFETIFVAGIALIAITAKWV
jgi:uncharacterized integral membrane protein (TIGR00698 family)